MQRLGVGLQIATLAVLLALFGYVAMKLGDVSSRVDLLEARVIVLEKDVERLKAELED